MLFETVILALLSLKGVGPKYVRRFLEDFDLPADPDSLHECVLDATSKRKPLQAGLDELREAWERAENVLASCEREGISVLGSSLPIPPLLLKIPDPPLLLFSKGNRHALIQNALAVIGTRSPTDFGMKSAFRMARCLAENNWAVVSGLAIGCDTEGHEGCLSGAGKTVAVLAHGFGKIYPAKNKGLAERILENNGCLLTEYAPGVPANRSSFIERDRLQSGLSLGIVVVETDIQGGTMHTVRHAQSQKRKIGAVAHPDRLLVQEKTRGNQKLIADGIAVPLADRNQVMEFAESLLPERERHLPFNYAQSTLDF